MPIIDSRKETQHQRKVESLRLSYPHIFPAYDIRPLNHTEVLLCGINCSVGFTKNGDIVGTYNQQISSYYAFTQEFADYLNSKVPHVNIYLHDNPFKGGCRIGLKR